METGHGAVGVWSWQIGDTVMQPFVGLEGSVGSAQPDKFSF